jgi:cytochrome P450
MSEFRALADEFFSGPTEDRRNEIIATVIHELGLLLDDRIANPRDDLMSRMTMEEIDGRKLTKEEMLSMCFFLFVAGLDTVANAAGFFLRLLARSPGLQRELVDDPSRINAFVDEALRTCGVVNTVRMVKKSVEIDGATLREGDMVVLMLTLAGLDPEAHEKPLDFDMDRASHNNMIFGSGVHLCAGHHLARTELRILIAEWLKRVPEFSVADAWDKSFRLGTVMALRSLPLTWPARQG